MDLLLRFKDHLIQGKDQPSKVTIKNYLADLRKFIRWYETTYNRVFHPLAISPSIIEAYKQQVTDVRSLKRYLSSLRKFFHYLYQLGAIPANPFDQSLVKDEAETNPWKLKTFKNFLYSTKASKLTIKNYIIDIRQFLEWLKQVLSSEAVAENKTSQINESDVYARIDHLTIEEYKRRLLSERQLSPVSINRKLSSLRKYITWLHDQKIIQKDIQISDIRAGLPTQEIIKPAPIEEIEPEISLEEIKEIVAIEPQIDLKKQAGYSKFPPLRLIQKSTKAITLLIDLLILLPIIRMLASGKYTFWKMSGRKVFAPVEEVFNSSLKDIPTKIIKNTHTTPVTGLNVSKIIHNTAKPVLFLNRLAGLAQPKKTTSITNLPKSMYAPLKISTKNFSLPKKIIYHIKHTRPEWYKRYHSYPIVHYFHLAIFFIATTTIGFGIYQSFFDSPRSQKPALAALPTAPPRILSFQGRLTDSSDTPITAATSLRFAIYNSQSASGSAMLWEEEQFIRPDEDGVFAALLGRKNAISQSLFANNQSLYLGVTVGSDSELQPRQPLATVAYAANAETLQGLVPITQENAGTTNVVLALDSAGNLIIGNNASPTFEATGGIFTLSGQVLNLTTTAGSNGNIELSPDGTGIVDIQRPLQNTQGALEVNDLFAIVTSSVTQSALTISQNGSGPIISASSGGTAKFSVDNNGSGTFADSLTINGTSLRTGSTSFSVLTSNVTNLYLGLAATSISIASAAGTTTINNALSVAGHATFNGGATIPSDETITISGTVASHLLPNLDGVYDIGSTSRYWRNQYLTNLFMHPTATTSGFWQRNNGALAPTNINDDLLIGGTTATAAKFGVSAATGNATTAGTLTFNTTGSIQTTNNQTLNLGGNTTGNIILQPLNGSGRVGIGTSNPLATLDINGSASTSGNLTFNSAGIIQTVKNQTLTIGGNATGNILLQPLNGSGNVGIGTSTPLARLDVNGNASVSGNLTFNSAGIIQTVANQTLTIGGNTTGNILLQPLNGSGNVGIGTSTPLARLDVNGNASVSGNLTFNSAGIIQTASNQTLTIGGNTTGNITLSPLNGSGNTIINGRVGINTANPLATFDLRAHSGTLAVASVSGRTSFAALAVDNSLGDLFTASSSGTNRFVIKQNGFVGIGTSTPLAMLDVNGSASLSGNFTFDSAGTIQTTENQNLTIGGSTTGNITVSPLNGTGTTFFNGKIAVNTSNPLATFDLRAHSGTLAVASVSGRTSFAALAVDNSLGDLFTASSSGTNRFVIKQNGFVGIGTSTPLAMLDVNGNASVSGNLTFNSAGIIQTVSNQTLTIGGSNTGNIVVSPLNGTGFTAFTGKIGVNTLNPLGTFDLRAQSGTAAIASISGRTSFAALTVDNSGSSDIFTASSSGATRLRLDTNGTILPGTNNTQNIGSSSLAWNTVYANNVIPGSVGIQGFWQRNNNAITPTNITDDLLLGATSTSSAKFKLMNVAGGTPTASISANSGNNATFLTGLGNLGTTNSHTLTIGGSTTGIIILDSGNNLLQLADNSISLTGSAPIINTTAGSLSLNTTNNQPITTGTGLTTIGGNLTINGTGITLANNSAITLGVSTTALNFGSNLLNLDTSNTRIGINTNAPTATLDVAGNASVAGSLTFRSGTGTIQTTANNNLIVGGNATGNITLSPLNGTGTVLNTGTFNLASGKTYQIAGTDVLSATALGSGVTSSSLTSVGTISSGAWNATIIDTQYGGTGQNFASVGQGAVLYFSNTGTMNTLPAGTTGQCLVTNGASANPSWTNCISGSNTTNWWTQTNGVLSPINGTADLLIGGNATSSAKFAVLNMNSGTPTASISANTGSAALFLTATGTISTINAQTLTIGGTNTGHIVLDSGNGIINFADASAFSGSATFNAGATVTSGQNLTLAGITGNNAVLYSTSGTGIVTSSTTNSTGLCLLSGSSTPSWSACPGSGSGASKWTEDPSGVLYANNQGLDFLLGGTASTSAKFSVLNLGTGTPTASVSGGATGLSLAGSGTIQAINNSSLTLGGNTTGNITLSPLNGTGITSLNGSLGINTASTIATLDIRALSGTNAVTSVSGPTSFASFVVDNSGSGDLFTASSSGSTRFTVANNGDVTITGSGGTCTMTGAATTTTCGSDIRLKTNVQDLEHSLDKIMELRPVTYTWINPALDQSTQVGFIAQEVQKIFPNYVGEMNNGYLGVRYESFIMPAIKAIQELNIKVNNSGNLYASQIDTLNQEIATVSAAPALNESFQSSIISLADRVASLEGKIASQSGSNLMNNKELTNLDLKVASLESSLAFQASQSAFFMDMLTNNPLLSFNASSGAELGLEKMETHDATVSGTLSVLGETTFNNVGITGTVNAGLLAINGLNEDGFAEINTIAGPLKLQSHSLFGIDIMDGKITIDTDGDLTVEGHAVFAKDVKIKGKLAANIIVPVPDEDLIIQLSDSNGKHNKIAIKNSSGKEVLSMNHLGDLVASGSGKFADLATGAINIVRGVQADTSVTESVASSSAGKALIKAHQTERTIYSPYVKAESLIYVTATSNTQGQVPYVARQIAEDPTRNTKGSFTVQIPTSVTKDIKFNWWIVN